MTGRCADPPPQPKVVTYIMRSLFVLAVLSLAACGDNPPIHYPTTPPAQEVEPLLGPGDVIELVIYYGTNESKATYRLGPTGSLSVQFIGDVDANGKTLLVVQEEIRAKLADGYLKEPIVQLTLVEANSARVSIFGQIQKAGTIKYVPGMTIVEAVAQSGGFTAMARKNMVQVTRMVDGKKVTYTVPVELIGEGRRPNFIMAAGDVVFVPERVF
jgi:polysaccharide export outer membrane protein